MNLRSILFMALIPAVASADSPGIQNIIGSQKQIQSSEQHQIFLADKEHQLQEKLAGTLVPTLESIYHSLSSQGVGFQDIRPKVNEINFVSSLSGYKAITIERITKNGEFAVRDTYQNPFVMPEGVDGLVTLRVKLESAGIDDGGEVTAACKASIEVDLFGRMEGTSLGIYGCTEVIEMQHIRKLESEFVKWLGKYLKNRQSFQ